MDLRYDPYHRAAGAVSVAVLGTGVILILFLGFIGALSAHGEEAPVAVETVGDEPVSVEADPFEEETVVEEGFSTPPEVEAAHERRAQEIAVSARPRFASIPTGSDGATSRIIVRAPRGSWVIVAWANLQESHVSGLAPDVRGRVERVLGHLPPGITRIVISVVAPDGRRRQFEDEILVRNKDDPFPGVPDSARQ